MQLGSASLFGVIRTAQKPALLLVLGVCVARFALFMVAPFMVVILNTRFDATIEEIGLLFSVAGVIGLTIAPIGGALADRVNIRTLMLAAVAATVACYMSMMLVPTRSVFIGAILIISVAGGVLEPLLRSILGDCARDDQDRAGLYHLRYFGVNIAAATGPLAGIWFMNQDSTAVFGIAAVGIAFLGFTVFYALRAFVPHTPDPDAPRGARLATRHMLANRLFLGLFAANFLLVFIYAQTDEPLVFLMISMEVADIPRILAILSMINAVTVLLVHGLFMNRIVALGEARAMTLACICVGAALALITLNPSGIEAIWFLAIGVATLGEIIAMPLFLTIIDRIAPKQHRNSYFGIYYLSSFGGTMAPFFAALVISHFGGTVLFGLATLLCLPLGIIGILVLSGAPGQAELNKEIPV